jgi:hypothetical protein
MTANKSLKVCSSLRFVTDSFSLGMLRILCPAFRCPLALRYAAIAFFLVLISAGPHAGLLPDWAENAVLLLGWVSVIVLPIITARKVWRSRGII